jgi:uncharacterized protein with HEPN domain
LNQLRLDDYLDHIEGAARRAIEFIGDQSRAEFLADIKTQQAVAMSFAIMGEAATRIAALYPDFIAGAPDIGWREMRGMRHHLVYGYFRIDYEIVWDTVHDELPRLLQRIAQLRADLSSGHR